MDPNEALKNARAALVRFRRAPSPSLDACTALDAADDLADAFQALDTWLTYGGFLPDEWKGECKHVWVPDGDITAICERCGERGIAL
jgi:hypothetical protein